MSTEIDVLDELNNRLHQLSAMMKITGDTGDSDSFHRWSDEIQSNYLWACSEMVDQANVLSDKSVLKSEH